MAQAQGFEVFRAEMVLNLGEFQKLNTPKNLEFKFFISENLLSFVDLGTHMRWKFTFEYEASEKITFIDSDDALRPGYIIKESGKLYSN